MNIPIISLNVEGMKHTMKVALMQHQLEMDSMVQSAIDAYCTSENISRIVHSAAEKALDEAIKAEVTNFFRFGDGRKAVAAAVKEAIMSNETYKHLDDIGG